MISSFDLLLLHLYIVVLTYALHCSILVFLTISSLANVE